MLSEDDKKWLQKEFDKKPDKKWVREEIRTQISVENEKLRQHLLARMGGYNTALEQKIELNDERTMQYRDQIMSHIDSFAGEIEKFREENTIAGYQFKRHERWIEQLAEKTATKLES